jgi:hypothetical protein
MTGRDSAARDVLWLLIAGAFAGLTVRYLWDIAALLVEGPPARDAVLLVVVGAVIALAGIWLTLGAWRRTRWARSRRPSE